MSLVNSLFAALGTFDVIIAHDQLMKGEFGLALFYFVVAMCMFYTPAN